MKKILPIFLISFFVLAALLSPVAAFAQTTMTTTGTTPAPARSGIWVVDPEVTFIGKNAARSGLLLDWTLQNYNWVCVSKIANRQCDDSKNPLRQYWSLIGVYIVIPMLFIVILVTALVIIISRGRSITIMRFLPRFVAVILLIIFSYAIVQFLAQFTDAIQGFFLRKGNSPCPPACISQQDLLFVGWKYQSFVGLRLLGDFYAESAFISLLLTKLTALTYFVMVTILLVRKIILWFFIIVSPIFPLLLLYYPVRNTGKIWIGEFFRWLLYAPLFALFLKGLVFMWGSQIPLVFANPNIGKADQIVFPTAVNILLGGPKQFVTPTNSVNITETFALYLVAIIMLWIVIILPWILLQIFLEYASNFVAGDTAIAKSFMNTTIKKGPPSVGPVSPRDGLAAALPFTKKFAMPTSVQPTGAARMIPAGAAKAIPTGATQTFHSASVAMPMQAKVEAVNTANIQVPTMRDIAKYDTALLSKDTVRQQSVTQMNQTLEKIANPVAAQTLEERNQYSNVRQKLMQQSQQGNVMATTILKAANSVSNKNVQASNSQVKSVLQQIANPASSSAVDREKITAVHDVLVKESTNNNNQLAASILSVTNTTSEQQVQTIHSQLQQVKGSRVENLVSTAIAKQVTAQNVLKEIATSTTTADREQFVSLHETVKKAGSEGNVLATSILSVSKQTSIEEVKKIQEKIIEAKQKADPLATQVVAIEQKQNASTPEQTKEVLKGVANPAVAPIVESADKEKITKLREDLKKASAGGNALATSILSISEQTSSEEIHKLQDKIAEAKEKGEPVAAQIVAMTHKAESSLPATNRVQAVSQQDYQAVKDMWKENYQKLEVPEGIAGTRTDWIKDDVSSIDEIVGLLSSADEEKVTEGLDQVSGILPFLLVGGFSQTEIIAYLKAKQEAAKQVIGMLVTEEEQKVTVGTKKKEAEMTMAASIEEEPSKPDSSTAPLSSARPKDEPVDQLDKADEMETKLKKIEEDLEKK